MRCRSQVLKLFVNVPSLFGRDTALGIAAFHTDMNLRTVADAQQRWKKMSMQITPDDLHRQSAFDENPSCRKKELKTCRIAR